MPVETSQKQFLYSPTIQMDKFTLQCTLNWIKSLACLHTYIERDKTFNNFLGVYTNYPLSRQSCVNFTTNYTLVPYSHDATTASAYIEINTYNLWYYTHRAKHL